MYVYLGKVSLGPLSGCLRLLGRRLHIKTAGDPATPTSSATWGIPSQRGEAKAPYAEAYRREEGRRDAGQGPRRVPVRRQTL